MTVSSTTNRPTPVAGNGTTTAFAFSYPYRASSDLRVLLRDNTTHADTLQTEGTDYTVSGVANANTGGFDSATINFVAAPATGKTVIINRQVPLTSPLDPNTGAALTAPNIEGAIDRLTLQLQALREMIARTPILPEGTSLANLELPDLNTDIANNLLAVNATGDGYTAVASTTLVTGQTLSAFMQTLADDTTAAAARTTLGLGWQYGFLYGLGISRSAATIFGIAAGSAVADDSGSLYYLTLGAAITKTLSAWAVGSGNGGLDTGAVANATWYHVHLIRKDSDGSIDALYSTSATGPTMPSGYTARRRLGSFKTDGAAQIVAFSQVGDEFLWDAAVVDVDDDDPGTAAVTRTLSTPLGVKTISLLTVGIYSSTQKVNVIVSSLDVSDQAPQAAATAALSGFSSAGNADSDTNWAFMEQRVRTNTSSQVRSRASATAGTSRIGIITRGWIDSRGK